MKKLLTNLVNSNTVFNTFANLKFRWADECRYENFEDYASVMKKSIEKEIGKEIELVKGTKRPFGIVFKLNGETFHLTINARGNSYFMRCVKLTK